jgi:hypothetical protein
MNNNNLEERALLSFANTKNPIIKAAIIAKKCE